MLIMSHSEIVLLVQSLQQQPQQYTCSTAQPVLLCSIKNGKWYRIKFVLKNVSECKSTSEYVKETSISVDCVDGDLSYHAKMSKPSRNRQNPQPPAKARFLT